MHMTKTNCTLQSYYMHDKTNLLTAIMMHTKISKLLTAITIHIHFLLSTPTQFHKASTLVTFSIIYNSQFFTTFHYPLHNFKRLSLQPPVAHALFSQYILFSRHALSSQCVLSSRHTRPKSPLHACFAFI